MCPAGLKGSGSDPADERSQVAQGERSRTKKAILVVIGNAGRFGAEFAFFASGFGHLAGVSGFHAVIKSALPGGIEVGLAPGAGFPGGVKYFV